MELPLAPAAPALPEHNYVCLKCRTPQLLQKRDAVKCEVCNYRILLKLPQPNPGTDRTVIAR